MEPQATLVGAERGVELHAKATIDLHLALIVNPGHAENDLTFRLAQTLYQGMIGIIGLLGDHAPETFQHLDDGLVKLCFAGIAAQHLGEDGFKLFVNLGH